MHFDRNECAAYNRWEVWTVTRRILDEVSERIRRTPSEVSGAIFFEGKDHVSTRFETSDDGKVDSVDIRTDDEHVVSFHTHPTSAYLNAECVYGHPSADDLREYLRLSRSKGMVNHLVFTIEGVYLVQVCIPFLKAFKRLGTGERRAFIKEMYTYFHETHGRRMLDNVIREGYEPETFLDMVNSYTMNGKRVFMCELHPSDGYRERKRDPRGLWNDITHNSVKVKYKRPLQFRFMSLDRRSRSNCFVSQVIDECPAPTFSYR